MKPPPRTSQALQLLLDAYEYSQDLNCPVWDFALEIAVLREGGLNNSDLRWLVYRRYLLHAPEAALLGAAGPPPRAAGRLALSEESCFVLTPEGVSFARSRLAQKPEVPPVHDHAPAARAGPPLPLVPHWDKDRRELRLGELLVKQFKVPAPNQEIILGTLQDDLWPAYIDDPLPPHPCIDPKRRLHDTLGSLNRNQKHPLIRFLGNGNGEGVRWESAPARAGAAALPAGGESQNGSAPSEGGRD